MESFKHFITEASGKASTIFETVIVICHNNSSLSEKKFKDMIMKEKAVKDFLKAAKPPWAVANKSAEEQADILYKFAQVCKKQIGSGKSDAGIGQSNPTVSTFWSEETGKSKDVSKTDVIIAGHRTSVKGPSAQLMSGKKPEVRATILSAAEAAGIGANVRKSLLEATDKFVETTSKGMDMTTANLRKLSKEEAIATGNREAQKVVEQQKELQAEVNKAFTDAFKDKKIAYEFAKEAMTGREKFSAKSVGPSEPGDTIGEATHMLVWDYRMDRLMFRKIDEKIVGHSAKGMKVNAGFKSGSKKSVAAKTPTNPKGKVGYDIFQTLRIQTEQLIDKQGEFVKKTEESVQNFENQLNEGVISEVDFKAMVAKAWNALKGKLLALYEGFKKMITSFINNIKELLNNYSLGTIVQEFNGDVVASVNTVVKFKL